MSDRERLPTERQSKTSKIVIRAKDGTYDGYLTVGFYDDGRVGEFFIRMDKQGSQVSGLMDSWAIAVSMLLQTGTPLSVICNKFRGFRFEPAGPTNSREVPFAQSPVDFVARWLEVKFVDQNLAESVPIPSLAASPESATCERCGCEDGVHLSKGIRLCTECRSGKTPAKKAG